jgi:hypothetical protein
MKFTAGLLAAASIAASAATADPWQSPLPPALSAEQFAPATFTEVALPARSQSLVRLESRSFVPVDPNQTPSPIPTGFHCPVTTNPFLVRALQWNPAVSGYAVEIHDGNLKVRHVSLGSSASIQRAALVVCLDASPRQVFVEAYGAQ